MVPAIRRHINIVLDKGAVMPTPRRLQRATLAPKPAPSVTFSPVPGRRHPITRVRMISQTALNSFVTKEGLYKHQAFIPAGLTALVCDKGIPNYAHFASLMFLPVTGRTISIYKKLMHDPATAEVWQTAFGKDFEGMAQSNEKTGQKRANSMFVMNHNKIMKAYAEKQKFTYAKIVVDYCPQKEDPHRIPIMAGGNLNQYKGDISTHIADLTTSKLLWNIVLSTWDAKYMCLDIKKFYLTAMLEYFKYIQMPLVVFPDWIK
jgi:hypothetical protein